MVEIVEAIVPSRGAVRSYVASKAPALESAQAGGRLARVKIDLKDEAEAIFTVGTADEKAALRVMVDEEIEALCADLRLATVTVQAQIERRPRNWGRGAIAAVAVFVVGVLVMVGIGTQDGVAGFGVPLIAAAIAFFVCS